MNKRLIFIFLFLIKSAFASYAELSFNTEYAANWVEQCTTQYQLKIEMGWEKHQMYAFCKCSVNKMREEMRKTDKLPSEKKSQQIANACINLIESNYQHY
jgi:hypothetical protein